MSDDDLPTPAEGMRRPLWRPALVFVAVFAVVLGTSYAVGRFAGSGRPSAGSTQSPTPSPTSSPTESPTPSPTPSRTTTPMPEPAPSSPVPARKWSEVTQPQHKVDVALAKLDRGPDPGVPWYADGVIHHRTPIRDGLPATRLETTEFHRLHGGYGVAVDQPEAGNWWEAVIDPRGGITRRMRVLTTSADGRYAASVDPARGMTRVPVVYDLKTGQTMRGEARMISGVAGFLGDNVYVDRHAQSGSTVGLALWDPMTDTYEEISPDIASPTPVTDDVAAVELRIEEGWCGALYSFRHRAVLQSCADIRVVGDSPYAVLVEGTKYVVFDVRTGEGLLEIGSATESINEFVLEPGGALLLKLTTPGAPLGEVDGSRAAVVRCTLSGQCELASKVYRQTDSKVFRTLVQLPA